MSAVPEFNFPGVLLAEAQRNEAVRNVLFGAQPPAEPLVATISPTYMSTPGVRPRLSIGQQLNRFLVDNRYLVYGLVGGLVLFTILDSGKQSRRI